MPDGWKQHPAEQPYGAACVLEIPLMQCVRFSFGKQVAFGGEKGKEDSAAAWSCPRYSPYLFSVEHWDFD